MLAQNSNAMIVGNKRLPFGRLIKTGSFQLPWRTYLCPSLSESLSAGKLEVTNDQPTGEK